MKRLPLTLLSIFLAAPAFADSPDSPPPATADYLFDISSSPSSDIPDARMAVLQEAGRQAGYRAGKARRSWELLEAMKVRESTLDALFDFRTLISREGWLPPVISEAKDVAHITEDQIRTSSHIYQIVSPARFVSNPPSWRNWLTAGLSSGAQEFLGTGIAPDSRSERKVWQAAVSEGWTDGRDGADHIFEANMNRLTRDYQGMVLYSALLRQGYITRPDISDEVKTVSGDKQKLITGDRVRRLKTQATFVTEKQRWIPVIETERTKGVHIE